MSGGLALEKIREEYDMRIHYTLADLEGCVAMLVMGLGIHTGTKADAPTLPSTLGWEMLFGW